MWIQTNIPTRDTVLLASPHLQARRRSDGALELDTHDAVITYGGEHAERMAIALEVAARPCVAGDLATGSVEWERLVALLKPALESGALRDVSALMRADDSSAQLSAYYELCDDWAREIFIGPFWSTVLSGAASTRLMLGWCEQFYHRTVGADTHNDIAVENCAIPSVRDALRAHFSEEFGHGEIFLQGFEQAEIPRATILGRPPLASTRALLEFFNHLAASDTLAYLACYGVLHSPRQGQTMEAVRSQFAALAEAYPEAAPVIRRVGSHAEIDIDAAHDQIAFERYLLARPPLDADEATRVVLTVRGTVDIFNRFFAGILAAYGDERGV